MSALDWAGVAWLAYVVLFGTRAFLIAWRSPADPRPLRVRYSRPELERKHRLEAEARALRATWTRPARFRDWLLRP